MKSLIRKMLLVFVVAIAAGCATTAVVTADYDRSANFSAYRTFGFFEKPGTDSAGYQSLVTQTLKSAVRREMEARAYTYAPADPDLLINFDTQLAQRTRISQTPAPMYYGYPGWGYRGWGGYYGGWGGWGGYGYDTWVDQYEEGTLRIDIVDARRKQLVWEGVAIARVTNRQRQDRQAAINAAVVEIFARYPFRAGG